MVSRIESLGGAAVGIGTAAGYQARRLMERSIPYRLLVDPDRAAYDAFAMRTQSLTTYVLNLRAWLRWLRHFPRRGQGRITGHYSVTPGVVVVDASGRVHFAYRGSSLGDYPKLDDVLAALAVATGNNP